MVINKIQGGRLPRVRTFGGNYVNFTFFKLLI